MNAHNTLIDQALAKAKARMNAGVESTSKVASVPGTETDSFLKEASTVADALEFLALSVADDGSAQGTAQRQMVESFFKQAETAGPKVSETTTTGTQGQPPAASKTKIQPGGSPGSTNPTSSEAPTGSMPENVLRTMPPSTAPTPTDKGGEKAAGKLSLHDILMNHHAKEAAGGGAMELDSEQPLPQTPKGQEGKAYADKLLGSNTAPVAATKREAKAPGRPRAAEIWGHTNDTVGDSTASAVWPGAAAKGDMKVASVTEVMPGGPAAQRAAESAKTEVFSKGKKTLLDKAKSLSGKQKAGIAAGAAATGLAALGAKKLMGGKKSEGAEKGAEADCDDKAKDEKKMPPFAAKKDESKDDKDDKKPSDKKASFEDLANASEIFEKALAGELGPEAQNWALQLENV